ncbi:NADP-dependent oxidoreductase domain-containing protein [Cyathus striatus]|nr:NADP-dependent oxidoreductase domain-containing protein [Cyathus striatus]
MAFPPPPLPSALGCYRLLSPNAGVHVSPLQFGAFCIGDEWEAIGLGGLSKEKSFELMDAYFELGGNFIDTACNYQAETSEQIIGEWAESRGIRDQLFIATKFTTNFKLNDTSIRQKVFYGGNSSKTLHLAFEASLKKLRTSYIDLYYVHWWDFTTSIEEVMRSLHILVLQRKVLYLGVSDTPAWVVSRANQYARDHALTPFVVYQGSWSLLERSFEREIIPMARAEGMALAPWNVLGAGKIRTDEEEERRHQTGEHGRKTFDPNGGGQGNTTIATSWERNEQEKKVCKALEKVAEEVGAKSIVAVAIAYVMQKTPFVFPIIGARKIEQWKANLEALEISLSKEQIKYIESLVPFELGFPGWMIGTGEEYNFLFSSSAHFDKPPLLEPVRPAPKSNA